MEPLDKKSDSAQDINGWAEKEQQVWENAILETQNIQESYNRILTQLDQSRRDSFQESRIRSLRDLLDSLNRTYDIRDTFEADTGRRFSGRWWLQRLTPKWWGTRILGILSRPLLERQTAFHGVLIHFINDLQQHLSSHLMWLQQLLEIQMAFLLQITPWMDVKIRELRSEQNHNVAMQIGGMIHRHFPNSLRSYNEDLQKQLSIMSAEMGSIQALVAPLAGISLPDVLHVAQQRFLDLQKQVDDLWHGLNGRHREFVQLQERLRQLKEELDAFIGLDDRLEEGIQKLDQSEAVQQRNLEESRAGLQQRMDQALERLKQQMDLSQAHLQKQFDETRGHLQQRVGKIEESRYPGIRPDMQDAERMRVEIEELKRQVSLKASPKGKSAGIRSPLTDLPGAANFRYFMFEEIFRGPQEYVREKIKRYLPYFEKCAGPVLDIGCGRGEFLQLMKEAGTEAYGAELNSHEIAQLRQQGISVVEEDAVAHLNTLKMESLGGVFCAQVVEHLAPEEVFAMIQRLFLVMKSGAPAVIETLNPLSVQSFHSYFLLDPTHRYPVHPQALVFWMRYAGFRDVQVHRITPFPAEALLPEPGGLQVDEPLKAYLNQVTTRLNDVLFGYAEYFVVGYRP